MMIKKSIIITILIQSDEFFNNSLTAQCRQQLGRVQRLLEINQSRNDCTDDLIQREDQLSIPGHRVMATLWSFDAAARQLDKPPSVIRHLRLLELDASRLPVQALDTRTFLNFLFSFFKNTLKVKKNLFFCRLGVNTKNCSFWWSGVNTRTVLSGGRK